MKTLLVLDLPDARLIPERVLGCAREEVVIARERVRAVLGHPADVLALLDREAETPALVVVSSDRPPDLGSGSDRWGFGWRCGRPLERAWVAIAREEGRITSAEWWHAEGGDVRACRLDGPDAPALVFDGALGALLRSPDVQLVACPRRASRASVRYRDQSPPPSARPVRVFHGSPRQGLERLSPPELGRLWVSTARGFAASFGASPYSNLGFAHGVERVPGNEPVTYLAVPREREDVLEIPCSLYELELEASELRPSGVLGFEFVVRRTLEAKGEERFDSAAEALEALGVAVVRLGSSQPCDMALAKRCEAHRQALAGWLGLDLDIALRLPWAQWRLVLWLVARGLAKTEEMLPHLVPILSRDWLPWAARRSGLPERGYHSLEHAIHVALLGTALAVKQGVNPVPVMLFGLLHDLARLGDEDDGAHAVRSAAMLDDVLQGELRYLLDAPIAARLRTAILQHGRGQRSDDVLVGCCWDADRLRLAWERGVDPRFFSTPLGLDLARAGEAAALEGVVSLIGGAEFFGGEGPESDAE